MIDRFERFVTVISGINRNLHRIMTEEMEKYGLKGSFAVYLIALYRNPAGMTAARLSEFCEKNKAAVSRAVTELEEKGLIVREGGYRASLRLTPEGKKAAGFLSELAKLAVDQAGKGLSEEHREIFYSSIERIAQNLESIGDNGLV